MGGGGDSDDDGDNDDDSDDKYRVENSNLVLVLTISVIIISSLSITYQLLNLYPFLIYNPQHQHCFLVLFSLFYLDRGHVFTLLCGSFNIGWRLDNLCCQRII